MPLIQDGTSLSQPFFESCLLCFALLCYLLCESFKKSPLQACKVQWWCSGHDPSSQCHALTMPHTHTRMSLHATLKHASQRQSAVYVCCLPLKHTTLKHATGSAGLHLERWRVWSVCAASALLDCYIISTGPSDVGASPLQAITSALGADKVVVLDGLSSPKARGAIRHLQLHMLLDLNGVCPHCLYLSVYVLCMYIQTSLCRAYTTTYRPLYVEHTQQRTDLSMSSIHNNVQTSLCPASFV